VEYGYEQPLTIGGVTKYPDFTIEDAEAGRNFYWEHCGMLHVPSYRRRWEEKLAWYKANGILPHEEGGGPHAIPLWPAHDLAKSDVPPPSHGTGVARSPVPGQADSGEILRRTPADAIA
ncbi:MAG: hypothetical protein ACLPKT_23250, partial [Methylocella sp.]